jgi:endonuclease/exonuclease/phosphatase (EEP) superfamily protein YafD
MRILVKAVTCLAALATIALSIVVASSFFNRLHPALDSVAHFRLHLAFLLVAAAIVATLGRKRKIAVLGGLVVSGALYLSAPYLPGIDGLGDARASSTQIRVVSFNTRFSNKETDLAVKAIMAADPDIVLLQEVTDNPKSTMNLLRDSYPYQLRCRGSSIGGTAVISKHPIYADGGKQCFDTPFLTALRVPIGGQTITFASYHAHWPWPHDQNKYFEELRTDIEALPHPLAIGGDFNATPWSEGVQRVARASGTEPVTGLRLTWLTPHLPLVLRPVIGLPIDHLLISDDFVQVSARTLDHSGSDHLPVLFEIALP